MRLRQSLFRNYYKLANVHILSQTLVSHHRNDIAAAAAAVATVTAVTAMILSDATMGITIIEMSSYLCCDLLLCYHMRIVPLSQLDIN